MTQKHFSGSLVCMEHTVKNIIKNNFSVLEESELDNARGLYYFPNVCIFSTENNISNQFAYQKRPEKF